MNKVVYSFRQDVFDDYVTIMMEVPKMIRMMMMMMMKTRPRGRKSSNRKYVCV